MNSAGSPSVLIVVLNWNSYEETIAAVESIAKMDYQNCRTVVIDNGSTDKSVEQLEKVAGDRVRLIRLPENLGFSGGCNVGLDLAVLRDDDYIWLLNGDAVTEVHTLSSLVSVAETDKRIGLVSPMIASLDEPSKLLNVGGLYEPELPSFQSTKDLKKAQQWAAACPERVMLMGTALLIRVEMVRQIGPLDREMFAYWEDTDISLRSIKAGFRNVVDFGSVVYHKEKTIDGKYHELKPHYWYYMTRNELRMLRIHFGPVRGLRRSWWSVAKFLRLRARCSGNPAASEAILVGLWHGWIHREGPYSISLRAPRAITWFADTYERYAVSRST